IVGCPTRGSTTQERELFAVAPSKTFDICSPCLALELRHNCTIFERIGQRAYGGYRLRRPGRKSLWLVLTIDLDIADNRRDGFGMSRIENAAHLFVVLQKLSASSIISVGRTSSM